MIDDKGRLFGKVSVVDLLILVLVGIILFGVFRRVETVPEITGNQTFTTQLEIANVREFTVDAIQIGDEIYEQHADLIGKVTDIKVEQANILLEGLYGDAYMAPADNRYTITLTLECVGRVTENGYYVNGNRQLATGGALAIQSKYIETTGKITNVE